MAERHSTNIPDAASAEYRIEYRITRCIAPNLDEEFIEIGFGSSGTWDDIDSALHAIDSDIQCRQWETEPGQPDPEEIS